MDNNTFWDKRATSVILGLFITTLAIHNIVKAFSGMSPSSASPAAPLLFIGSIGPFMIGLMVTIFVATPGGKLVNMTWHTINNMFAGLLGGYFMYLLGISSMFAGSLTNAFAGGIIAGIGASLAVAALIKWP